MREPGTLTDIPTNRREFLQGVGGVTLVIGSSGLLGACTEEQAARIIEDESTLTPNIWVRIGSDDTITIQFPATEMGQGSSTSLPVILADEMDADWEKVIVETVAVHDTAYGNPYSQDMLYTAGSLTVQAYFERLRRAGGQARKLLMQAAAERWEVPAAELETEPSVVLHPPSGRRLSYGEIAAFARIPEAVPTLEDAELKPFGAHRYMGTDIPRRDMAAKSASPTTTTTP